MKIKGATCVLLLSLLTEQVKAVMQVQPIITQGDYSFNGPACPSDEKRASAIQMLRNTVVSYLHGVGPGIHRHCGAGDWVAVVLLNMSIPSQQCPSNWLEYNSNGIRACGRPSSSPYCRGVFFSIPAGKQYSKVCGRAIGYEYGGQEAFVHTNIDSNYVYGLSITHGLSPRQHIWTYAVGNTEGGHARPSWNCPCADPDHPSSDTPPSFVGENFYCESGNPTNMWSRNAFYPNDPLWDGEQCEGTCCSDGKSPPWFNVSLPNPTRDSVEVRICTNEPGSDTKVQILEIFVA